MSGSALLPGDAAPSSGIYSVTHGKAHDAGPISVHEVTIVKGETFPRCAQDDCDVTFSLKWKAHHVLNDKLLRALR